MNRNTIESIFRRTEKQGDCLVWTSRSTVRSPNGNMYPIISFNGKSVRGNRLVYELCVGPFDKKLCVLHKCDNPLCINPDHLFLGTNKDNSFDMMSKGRSPQSNKTHCSEGHAYSEENTYITPKGSRQCRICKKAAKARWING